MNVPMRLINVKKWQHTMQQAPNHWMATGKKVNSKSQAPCHPNLSIFFNHSNEDNIFTRCKFNFVNKCNFTDFSPNTLPWTKKIKIKIKKSYILKVLLSAINFVLKFMVLILQQACITLWWFTPPQRKAKQKCVGWKPQIQHLMKNNQVF